MTLKEIVMLIGQLEQENKSNSIKERQFNIEWIKELKNSIKQSFK